MNRRGYEQQIAHLPRRRDQVLPALHEAHDVAGWLPEAAIEAVSLHTFVPLSDLYGVISSYSEFRLAPPHAPPIEVCTGLSCLIAGASDLVQAATDAGVHVERIACRFLCGVAPVAEVAGTYHGRLTPERFTFRACEAVAAVESPS